jgi:hypothetical protein
MSRENKGVHLIIYIAPIEDGKMEELKDGKNETHREKWKN